ncbi:metallophosphoesterase family protein [Agaribacter flavus]|uniref:Metallophosphoesterase family protein n=1 Tax=Agaribacter flavus TaxID=1902781 RepID=A0ABV7FLC8_9ALTE
MKIALISDIHSNVYALDAVIKDIERRGVDVCANLGDILYGPIAPKQTFELLMQHDFVTISGNQDRQIYESTQDEIASNPTMQFILDDLEKDAITWLKSLPFDKQLTEDVYLCHGSPQSDLIYFLENVESGRPRIREDKDIVYLSGGQNSKVICCGHTHIPRAIYLSTKQWIVNPGSVGLQAYTDDLPYKHAMENFNPFASYALIEKNDNAAWFIEHIRVPYDIDRAAAECAARKRSDWAHYITTGRIPSDF